MLSKLETLKEIQADFPKNMNKKLPVVPDVDEAEFPEHKLKPVIILPEEEEEGPVATTSKDMFVQVLFFYNKYRLIINSFLRLLWALFHFEIQLLHYI